MVYSTPVYINWTHKRVHVCHFKNINTRTTKTKRKISISLICIIFLGSPYHYSSMSLTYTARKQLLNTITKYEIN